MEKLINQNPLPRFDLLPHPIHRAGEFLGRLCRFFPSEAPAFMSTHYKAPVPQPEAQTDDICHVLDGVPPTIDEALDNAISQGRMSIAMAEECREAYNRVFHKQDPLASIPQPVTSWPTDAA